MPKDDLTAQLIRLANDFGADDSYARAGGGNASVKADGVLYIKPSGTTLEHLRADDLVPLRISTLLATLTDETPVDGDPVMVAAAAARMDDGERRPSVEILFHALIPDPLVLHLHPLVANAVTCNVRGAELAAELLGDEVVWVDYIDPGVPLARGVDVARKAYEARTGRPAPALTLMGNHGIIAAGHTYGDVAERIAWLTATIQAAVDATPAPVPATGDVHAAPLAESFRAALGSDAVAWTAVDVVRTSSGLEAGPVSRGPLIPDQIVYAGSFPCVLARADDDATVAEKVAEFEAAHGRRPVVAVVPGEVVIGCGATDKAASNALATFLDALAVARDADRLGGVRVMDARERQFIETWEAEAYRQAVAAKA